MSVPRIIDAALGGMCLITCIAELVVKGFPYGGMAFLASVALFRLAARRDA